jgi:phospholipid transport system substrate-binding protein
MKKIIGLLLCALILPVANAIETAPEELIKQTTDRVLADIKNNAAQYRADPAKLYEFVDEVVLPHFDFERMTGLALGRYAKKVNAQQKPLVINEFRILLVRTYGKALLEYTDQSIKYLPMEGSLKSGQVTVKTEIQQSSGSPIPLDYSLKKSATGWKDYDISVDAISLVTNYRSSFARQIKKNGVDGLIQTLKDRNQE